ncbi:hypothetical protein HS7_09150 [Sulfolobales archaeon HS-7]|nr:hypothetical protein HS7_09150 [Sulfolobales archaeon HS-7]
MEQIVAFLNKLDRTQFLSIYKAFITKYPDTVILLEPIKFTFSAYDWSSSKYDINGLLDFLLEFRKNLNTNAKLIVFTTIPLSANFISRDKIVLLNPENLDRVI